MEAKAFRRMRIRAHLEMRMRMAAAVRSFFAERDFLEVETPIRIPAPAPEVHIDCVSASGAFLQASPELAMKELLASGFDRIFQLARCFRAGERGVKHLPEMTLLEWYVKEEDYRYMMEETEKLICYMAECEGMGGILVWQGKNVDLTPPFERLSVEEAFLRHGSLSMEAALEKGCFNDVMGLEIEPELGRTKPVFLHDYPASEASLARMKPENSALAERFELYICGVELCNAYTELVDAKEQAVRFREAAAERARLGKRAYPEAATFLEALGHMPPATGNALGFDRLVMLFSNAPDIDHATAVLPEEL
ncbi:EF-P lysine aminoacylase EpmA [Desulfobotulus sp. H1]|uniref:EF-P lysine aminoacylase EpmA n=1 Tax=Desulfobotulus pelophilus TaxID=2823377 RepID=A0ABT3N6M3_9BACT|nr:EF-P lysine aminoacylase EpmA [Desulfobotulus pelophilus]MCW7753113.1 EF-P lysine aminoacylase EpmA [Desulfobotulus pelophilus]